MKQFPIMVIRTQEDVITLCRYILKERANDINDFNNLSNVLISGRSVAKVPTSSTDITPADRPNDFNLTDDYLYYVVDLGGTAEWRRIQAQSW